MSANATLPNRRRLSNAEAAAYLGLRPDSLTVMRSRGDIDVPYYRVGKRRIMYDQADLDAYLARQRVEPITA